MNNKWAAFLFALAVRFVCGYVLGCLASAIFFWKVILRSFSHNNTHAPFILMLICGAIGSVVAMCKIPYWQRPWYKRQSHSLDALTSDEALAVYRSRSDADLNRYTD
jgi:hypothetical protein